MRLADGVEAIDLAIYLKEDKAMIIADLHLGYEQELIKKGILLPRTQYDETINRLDYIFDQIPKVDKIILNGDIKHEFGSVNIQEWREVLKLIDYLKTKAKNIIAIKGNHDTILGPIVKKRGITEVKEHKTGKILVIHGDYIPKKPAQIIIMGHEHPAISLREEPKMEKYKCYIKGKYKKRTLIVQPSFLTLTAGTDLTTQKPISPLLQQGIEKFECYIVDDKTHTILDFGKISEI